IICIVSCGEKPAYRIDGKLENLQDQTVYAVFEKDDITYIDTVECSKPGQFRIEVKDGNYNSTTLFFEEKTIWVTVYPEIGEKITITGDIHYPSLLQIKGGKINNELTSVRKKMGNLLKEFTDLSNQLKHNNGDLTTVDEAELTNRLTNVNHQILEQVSHYIQEHPDQKASVVLMQNYFTDADDTRKLDEFLALLDPSLKDYCLVRELEQFSEQAERTALGAEAPGFNVKNIYGETVSLDSLSQKYVLLTFTAPWCDMCHTENLHLDEIAQKYPKEQLDMVLVSLDHDMMGVKEILAKDSIQWNLVTDSAGQAKMLLELYNVSALPRSFLIDEEGKIILKTENGLEIKQTLEKILDEEE
ncbi:MAG: AhpC/TSA family protein, partial [Tannerellaceae bacterium]|nr:AhpC/TSA family protein [Tannerellaceae bacterium]